MQIKKILVAVAKICAIAIFFAVVQTGGSVEALPTISVSGSVRDERGSAAVQNATITVTAAGESTVLYGPVSSNASGFYEVLVDAGSYDIHITPPSGSNLQPMTVTDVLALDDVWVGNTQLPFIRHTFSGTLYDADNNPMPNWDISLDTATGWQTIVGQTDENGDFSIEAPALNLHVTFLYNNGQISKSVSTDIGSGTTLDLTAGNVNRDFHFRSVKLLTISIRDTNDNPVPEQSIDFYTQGPAIHLAFGSDTMNVLEYGSVETDNDGLVSIPFYTDVPIVAGAICATFSGIHSTVCNPSSVLMDSNKTLELERPATQVFSGIVRDSNNDPIPNATVVTQSIHATSWQMNSIATDENGAFSMTLLADEYAVDIQSQLGNWRASPTGFTIQSSGAVTSTSSIDLRSASYNHTFQLPPFTNLTVETNLASNSLAGELVGGESPAQNGITQGGDTYQLRSVITYPDQATQIFAGTSFAGDSLCMQYHTPYFSLYARICHEPALTVIGSEAIEIDSPPLRTFSGTVVNANNQPIPNPQISVDADTYSASSHEITTDEDGHFSITLFAAPYNHIILHTPIISTSSPENYLSQYRIPEVDLTDDDITSATVEMAPVVNLTVYAIDAFGNPAANQLIDVTGAILGEQPPEESLSRYSYMFARLLTDSEGKVVVPTITGLTLRPFGGENPGACTTFTDLPSSGLVCSDNELLVTEDATITLQEAPIVPGAVSGLSATSAVQNPVLSWSAATNGNSYQVYRDATLVGTSSTTGFTDNQSGSDGSHSYTIRAVGISGGLGALSSGVSAQIDRTAPTINYSVSASANAAGWNNANATVSFTCNDAISGVQSCNSPISVTSEGIQTVSASATDIAGNTGGITPQVKLDKTVPTVSSFTIANKAVSSTATLAVNASDSLSGVAKGEFFYGADPGVGNATLMTAGSGQISGTLPTTMPAGTYSVSVRAQDAAGNWGSVVSSQIIVTNPTVTQTTGSNTTAGVGLGDVLPGSGTFGSTSTSTYNFTTTYGASGLSGSNAFTFSYQAGNVLCLLTSIGLGTNCNKLDVTATSFSFLQLDGSNYSHGLFHGTATLVVDGVTTTNPFTVDVIDGNRATLGTQDHFTMKVFAQGANIYTATPIYQASRDVGVLNGVGIQ